MTPAVGVMSAPLQVTLRSVRIEGNTSLMTTPVARAGPVLEKVKV